MDYKKYLEMTKTNAYIELHKYYTQETILDVLGVARQENPHSAFLRWLFDIKGSHGLGDLPLRCLLETICLTKEERYAQTNTWFVPETLNETWNILSNNQKTYFDYIKYGRYEIVDASIANELVLEKQRRADIFIAAKLRLYDEKGVSVDNEHYFIIVIENKIHSLEHDNQTIAYTKAIFNKSQAEKYISDCFSQEIKLTQSPLILPIYLNACQKSVIEDALNSNSKSETLPCSQQFITINYQDILDGVLEKSLSYCTIDVASKRISEYIRCLGQATLTTDYSINTDSDGRKSNQQHLIMAVTNREKELAKQLLQNDYKQIIQDIFRSFTEDENRLVAQKEYPFWISIANVYDYLLREQTDLSDKLDDELREAVSCVLSSTNGTQVYYLNFNGMLIGFGSSVGKRTEQTVGELAYYLISQYIHDHKNETWQSIRDQLYATDNKNCITNNWLCGCLMPQSDVDELAEAWACKAFSNGNAVCGKYGNHSGLVNNTFESCILWTSRRNPLNPAYKGNPNNRMILEHQHSCPLYTQQTNQQLWHAYKSKSPYSLTLRKGRNIEGRGCHCYYDFLHNFFIDELQKSWDDTQISKFSFDPREVLNEKPKVSRSNKPLPPIEIGPDGQKEKIYIARFWTNTDIPKLIELLGLNSYISTSKEIPPKTPMSVHYMKSKNK